MRPLLISLTLAAAIAPVWATTVRYGDQFSDYYPVIVKEAPVLGPDIPLEKEVVVWSQFKNRKATLARSDGSKIPYEKEIGVVTVESKNGSKQYLLLKKFRTVELKWINDRLLLLSCNIGHMAGVEAIFDSQNGKWIYRQSMSYGDE